MLPISDRFNDYAAAIEKELGAFDIRGYVDDRSEKVYRKIRDTEMNKVPFMLIVGGTERGKRNGFGTPPKGRRYRNDDGGRIRQLLPGAGWI